MAVDVSGVRGTRILSGAVQMLLRTGVELGIAREQLLEVSGIEEDELSDRDSYLPFAKQVALGRAVIQARPGVNVGLASLRHVSLSTFGVVGYVLANAPDLSEALRLFLSLQRLITDGVRWELEEETSARLLLAADPRYERLGHPIEGLVGIWLALGHQLSAEPWRPTEVQFQHAPLGDPAEVEAHFGCPVRFRSPRNALVMRREDLRRPVRAGSVAAQPSLRLFAERKLEQVDGHAAFSSQVRAALFEVVPRGKTAKAEVASLLGVSPRTLNRRLQAEGTTFRDALDGVRRELAEAWLCEPDLMIYEIAFLLGYSEPSTFHRWFRRWTGLSPRAWRAKHGT